MFSLHNAKIYLSFFSRLDIIKDLGKENLYSRQHLEYIRAFLEDA